MVPMLESLKIYNGNEELQDLAKETTLDFYEGKLTLEDAIQDLKKKATEYY